MFLVCFLGRTQAMGEIQSLIVDKAPTVKHRPKPVKLTVLINFGRAIIEINPHILTNRGSFK